SDNQFAVPCYNCRWASAEQRPIFQVKKMNIRAGVHGRMFPGACGEPFTSAVRYRWHTSSVNNEKIAQELRSTMVQPLNIQREPPAMDCCVFQAIGGRTVQVKPGQEPAKSNSNVHLPYHKKNN
ncbi:hypothetical protein OOU_Y34scaffold00351g4, partial [Pyricularia oryzae Y34]